jgi:syntaxin-binding protein 5
VTKSEIRIFKPSVGKGASKSFEYDSVLCLSASVSQFELSGVALVAVFSDRSARAYSLPGLKELGRAQLDQLDASRLSEVRVAQTGDIIGWTGPSEVVVVPVWGTAQLGLKNPDDKMINPDAVTPPRPTISNLQWISGTQYLPPTDLDLLIGGPDRPPSKRMLAAAAAEANLARSGPSRTMTSSSSGSNPRAGTAQEGWGEYLTRQLNERTEKLNIMGDSMDNLQEQSAGWADDVDKFISRQKRNLIFGSIKSKFT